MELKTLKDLFIHQLEDLYSAESQLIKALPKMAKNASNQELKKALEAHLIQTESQRERLDQVFEILGEKPGRHKCKAMEGLIEEGEEFLKEKADADVQDAGIIACGNRIEHYEIAGYGTARRYASQLGESKAEKVLSQILEEERSADNLLTKIAESTVNIAAEK